MQKIAIVLGLIALLAIGTFATDDVVVLTDKNFDETISSNEHVFVEFYAPWCGHCKNLAPDWAKLASHFKEQDSKVVIAKVDATENANAANSNGVRGYPTLIFFKNGNPTKYEESRSLKDMINYIEKKSGPASTEIKTAADLEAFQKKGGVVAYIQGGEDSTEFKNWIRAATSGQLEDFVLAHVFDPAVRGDKTNTIFIYKAGEEPIQYPAEPVTKSKIVSWLQEEGYPLFEEISQQVWQRSQSADKPILAVFAAEDDVKLVGDLAKKFKGKVMVTHATLDKFKSLAERWGASGTVFPTGILANWKGSETPTMHIFNEETEKNGFNVESASAFVEAGLADTYESYMKSEPEPETQEGPTTVLVGKSYKRIVNDETKDVLVEFYAPWCGHCKSLAPIYDQLAEKFKGNDHIVIAKIDATANSLPKNVDVRGYPTLIFFPANNKAGIPYEGERDLESLSKFITEHTSKPVDVKEDL